MAAAQLWWQPESEPVCVYQLIHYAVTMLYGSRILAAVLLISVYIIVHVRMFKCDVFCMY